MRALLCAITLLLLASYSYGQKIPHIYQIRADTVRIYNTCDTAELVLENRTKDTLGFLFNKGKGRTEFRRLGLERIGASQLAIQGQDTIDLNFSSYGDTRYDLLSTNFIKITPGDSLTFSQWPNRKVVGYDAYNSPDMPAISNQANPGTVGKLYYNGLVVRDEDSGFDLAVNWNGELNGPNGAFLRTKDDTRSAWSKWRELLFKDYADTAYAPNNTETLQTVTARGNSTSQDILFGGTAASSAGLSWNFNTDVWRIFVESPQDTPAGDMIFESGDNDQEGWIFRSKNGTTPKQVLSIQPEGTFTYLGNNILHAGNHVAGSAFIPTLTGANVLSTFTTNASGHVTALTTRALTAADIGAAPATASGNYIQNQTAADQPSSGFRITGTGRSNSQFQIVKDGSNTVASAFQLYNAASTRGANIQLDANTNPGLNFWVHDGTTWQNRLALEADGRVGIGTADPILGVHIKNSTGGLILEANKPFATTSGGLFEGYNSGTPSAANQRLGGITMGALTNGTELRPSSQIDVLTAAAWSNDTSQSSYMRFMTTAIGTKQPSERMRIGADGTITMFNIPALGTAGTNFLTSNGGVISSRTAAQVLADLGAAPASTSGNYVQNLSSGTQTANFSISGTGNASTAFSTPLLFTNSSGGQLSIIGGAVATGTSNYRGSEIDLFGGSAAADGGEMVFRTGTGGSGAQQPERMRIDAAGNVGVNNNNPTNTLSVTGASSTLTPSTITTYATRISQAGSDLGIGGDASYSYIQSFNSKPLQINNVGNNVLLNVAGGNVGIGTTAPADKLYVAGNITSAVTGANSTVTARSASTGDAILLADVSGVWASSFRTFRTGGRTGIINNSTEAISILIGGDVGIGTTSPAAKLEVRDTSTVANTTEAILSRFIGDVNFRLEARKGITTNTAGGIATKFGLTYNGTENALINFHRGSGTVGGFMSFSTNDGTERMRIDGTGNVGIGTIAPAGKLEVNGATFVSGGANLSLKAASNDPGDIVFTDASNVEYSRIYNTSGGAALHLSTGSTPTPRFTVTNTGNVGVNTTAPAQKLEVANGNIRANGGNVQCGPTDLSVMSALTYTTGMGVVGTFTNSPFAVYTNSAEKVRIDAAGNVGIGVTAPTSKLHVAGAGLFTGQVQATSFFQSSLRSLKKDIQPFTVSALDIFKKVQVRTFKFKADTTGKTNIGFIADEVPDEMATPQRNGVDQASTVALLVKAVQELTEQNKALQEKISKLEAKMKEK